MPLNDIKHQKSSLGWPAFFKRSNINICQDLFFQGTSVRTYCTAMTMKIWVHRGQKRASETLELELLTSGCEPVYGYWEPNSNPMLLQQELFLLSHLSSPLKREGAKERASNAGGASLYSQHSGEGGSQKFSSSWPVWSTERIQSVRA